MRNTKNCRKLYRVFKLDRKTKINGNISGGAKHTHPKITTSTSTKRYNHQNLSYGFGALDAATN
jgi:hypothetical protein